MQHEHALWHDGSRRCGVNPAGTTKGLWFPLWTVYILLLARSHPRPRLNSPSRNPCAGLPGLVPWTYPAVATWVGWHFTPHPGMPVVCLAFVYTRAMWRGCHRRWYVGFISECQAAHTLSPAHKSYGHERAPGASQAVVMSSVENVGTPGALGLLAWVGEAAVCSNGKCTSPSPSTHAHTRRRSRRRAVGGWASETWIAARVLELCDGRCSAHSGAAGRRSWLGGGGAAQD